MNISTTFLAGHTALITGSALRLGNTIAQHLSANGANIVINYYRSHDAALLLVDQLRCKGRQAIAIQADITKEDSISSMTKEVSTIFGTIDILVHNAGPYTDTPLMSLPVGVWDTILDTNLKGAFLTAKAVHVGMRTRGWGRIINISAGSAFVRNHTIYSIAKTALNTLTETLALELAPEVTVNAIAPGMIDDPDVDAKPREEARITTPTLRLVTFEEIARMVTFICSPNFDNITGQVICMDGGKSLPQDLHPTALKGLDEHN